MRRLKIGVAGVGYLGYFHAQKYARLRDVELVAVADVIPERARRAARDFGAEPCFSHLDLIGRCEAASIAVPTQAHGLVAGDLLSAGIHCLVEKPITATLDEADQLIRLAQNHNLVLQVGHLERFNPAVAALSPHLTQPLFVEVRRLTQYRGRGIDVDVVLDLMIHDIDILLGLLKTPPVETKALGAKVITARTDVANARLEFPSGCVANLTASRISSRPSRLIQIFQPDSYLKVDCAERRLSVFTRGDGEGEEVLPGVMARRLDFLHTDPLETELAAFVRAVNDQTRPLVGGPEARQALAVALGIMDQIAREPALDG